MLSASRELELDIETLLARYGHRDLAALLLPRLLHRFAENHSAPVLHLPAAAWAMGSLEPIASALAGRGVLLVPRTTADVPNDGLEPSPEQMERAGRIDETVMAVDGSAGAIAFLEWWRGHVDRAFAISATGDPGARPEDRPWLARFLELAPARFSWPVLDDPGCNLSMWNLDRHMLENTADGVMVDDGWPLRFLNLPGFDPALPHRLDPHASRARVSRSSVLHEICERYAEELQASGWLDFDRRGDVGRRLTEDLVYDESLRAMYASARALGEDVEDLFSAAGTRAFLAWLDGPAPHGSAHGINRYVFHRVARERPDVLRSYPDLDGADGPGLRRVVLGVGRDELAIPDRFLPPRAGEGARRSRSVPTPAIAPAEPALAVSPAPTDSRTRSVRRTPRCPRTVRRTGGAPDRVSRPHAGTRRRRAGIRTGARRRRRASEHRERAAAPPGATGEARRRVRTARLRGPRPHRRATASRSSPSTRTSCPASSSVSARTTSRDHASASGGGRRTRSPLRWRRAFALVREIWVYSRFMAENIGAVAPVPTIALPPPVQAPAEPASPLRLDVPDDGGFLFLFVFDYLSTIQRKNPVGLIEAFKRAFAPGEGPRLLLKTINGPLRPLAEEEVLWAAHGRPDIHVIDRSLSAAELNGLMAACDCYVSLHRSEGFGLTMAEAMAIGKPVIGTGYSGNVDFMNPENSYLVEYETRTRRSRLRDLPTRGRRGRSPASSTPQS